MFVMDRWPDFECCLVKSPPSRGSTSQHSNLSPHGLNIDNRLLGLMERSSHGIPLPSIGKESSLCHDGDPHPGGASVGHPHYYMLRTIVLPSLDTFAARSTAMTISSQRIFTMARSLKASPSIGEFSHIAYISTTSLLFVHRARWFDDSSDQKS